MKKILVLVTVVLLLVLGASIVHAQSGYDLFQKALVKERAVGDVEEALRLYQRVVKEFAGNHALAAKAQLRMGLLYDRLGRKADAQRAYQAVVSQYADQTNEARQARAKIVVAAAQPKNIRSSNKTNSFTLRQAWAGPGGDSAISPDGRYLVYVDVEDALAVRDLTIPGRSRRLTQVGPWWDTEETDDPTFSPDGKLVAYLWVNGDHGVGGNRADLRIIPLDSSAPPRVLYYSEQGTELQPFDWSSDGKHILATLTEKGGRQIVLVSVADGSIRVLKKFEWGFPFDMSLSRDGRFVVYAGQARKESPERDIFILATDGTLDAPLVTQSADDAFPLWTPDGSGVLFLSRGGSNARASFIRVVDGKPQGSPEVVRRDVGWIYPLGFTHDGSFYYRLQSGIAELEVATLDPMSGTLAAQPATLTQRYVTADVDWSADGKYLAYVSGRSSVHGEVGPMIVVIRSVATGEEYELAPALRGFSVRPGSWAPDGQSLLVRGRDMSGRLGLFRMNVQTGEVTSVINEYVSHPAWLADGKSVVFIRWAGAVGVIVLRDVETGRESELYRPPAGFLLGSCVEVSRGRDRLAFYLRNQETRSTSVMLISALGEKPRELGPPVKSPEVIDDILAVSPDGRYVFFNTYERGKKEDKAYKVWRVSAEGGDPQEIRLPMEQLGYVGDMSFHPDGQRVAFISHRNKSEVWMMDNFLPTTPIRKTSVSRR